jgi:hypothetical protein
MWLLRQSLENMDDVRRYANPWHELASTCFFSLTAQLQSHFRALFCSLSADPYCLLSFETKFSAHSSRTQTSSHAL